MHSVAKSFIAARPLRSVFGLLVALSAATLAAPAWAGDEFIALPVRWCGVEGAASMEDPSVVGEATSDDVLWRRHERPSEAIYIPQVNMTFRSAATREIVDGPQSFPIIRDPNGTGGDLDGDLGENNDARIMCQRVWAMGDPLYFDANSNGVVNGGSDTLLSTDFAEEGVVGLGHSGAPLAAAPGNIGFVDADSDGSFQIGEPIYRDENTDGAVDAADTLLVNASETIVGNVEGTDLGAALLPLPLTVRYLDLIRHPANTMTIGYPHVIGLTAVNANDMDYASIDFPVHGVSLGDAIVVDDASQYLPPGGDFTLFETNLIAHEAGHSFGLPHGDGVDDDGNGEIDDGDDPAAPFPGAGIGTLCDTVNVMQYCWADNGGPGAPNMDFIGPGEPRVGIFTEAQIEIIRTDVLEDYFDRLVDPVTPPLVARRADNLGEIQAPFQHFDIANVEVRVDTDRAETTLTIETRRPFPKATHGGAAFVYIVDNDANPKTGGAEDALREIGIDSDFAGAEFLGIVKLQRGNVAAVSVLAYAPENDAFVELSDRRIRGVVDRLEVLPDFPVGPGADPDTPMAPMDPIPTFENVRLIVPIDILRLDRSSQLRAEFISVGPEAMITDRIRSSRIDFKLPVFPECQVAPATVAPGESATVVSSGLLPNRELHLLLGPDEVATGRSDGDGRANLTLPIPEDSRLGPRLVTVGALAVTADCIVEVAAEPDGNDGGVLPGVRFFYDVPFFCGAADEDLQPGVARGRYETLITLTNPSAKPVRFAKRASRALPRQQPGAVSAFETGQIGPQRSIAVECDEIRHMLPVPMAAQFRSGTLLVYTDGPLSANVTITARGEDGAVSSVQTLPVAPQPLD